MKTMTKALIVAGTFGVVSAMGMTGVAFAQDRDGHRGTGMSHHMGMGYDGGRGWGHHRGHGKGWHHHRRARHFMETYDTNDDGKVTREELETVRKARVEKFDADKDGKLSLKEFEALWVEIMQKRIVRRFQFFDVDGDAAVTLDEYQTPAKHMFRRFDRNEDGEISREDRRRRGGWWGRHFGDDRSDDDRPRDRRDHDEDRPDDN